MASFLEPDPARRDPAAREVLEIKEIKPETLKCVY